MSTIHLTDAERAALGFVMSARYDNVVETRSQTGDDEYDETDEDQCSVLVFMIDDWDFDPDTVASLSHLYDAIWVALDTPDVFVDGFEGFELDALKSAAAKVGYEYELDVAAAEGLARQIEEEEAQARFNAEAVAADIVATDLQPGDAGWEPFPS